MDTYTVRQPGMTAWSEGLTWHEACAAWREAADLGLRPRVYRDCDDVDVTWWVDTGVDAGREPEEERDHGEHREAQRDTARNTRHVVR